MWHSGDMSWENYQKLYCSLEKLSEDIKKVILTKIARDTNYKVGEVLQESKKFMSTKDYQDIVEKTIYFRLGGFDCYIDICECGECDDDY